MSPNVMRAPDTVDEGSLLARLRARDEAAYEALVRIYSGRLLTVTRRILSSEDDARETVHEAFILAFRGIERFEGGSRLSTWLHRIAVNAALMKLRSRKRKPEESIDALLPSFKSDGHHVETFVAWTEPVDVALHRREIQALVRRCIDQLPESYRTVLMLRDIEQLDTEVTAAMLGISTNAVKIRLHRARQALRTLLDPHFRPSTSGPDGGRP
jgi:RNA polymerase sigma-70 factor (ECF subfamily)